MQITLSQAELKDAVRSYLRTHRIDSDNIAMIFTATRGKGAGIVTTITLDAETCDEAKPDIKIDTETESAADDILGAEQTIDFEHTDDSVIPETSTSDTDSEETSTPTDDTSIDLGSKAGGDKLFG